MKAYELIPFIALLQRYYAGAFARNDEFAWHTLEVFTEEPLAQCDAAVRDAVIHLSHPSKEAVSKFPYEFNRLFIGPNRLEAAPYETVYVSDGRSLMGPDTLSVRASYREGGFEPAALNCQPDDHIALELAFLEHTLGDNVEMFGKFFNAHLGRWYAAHAHDIRMHTHNDICVSFANLLDAVCSACKAWLVAPSTNPQCIA